MFGFFVCLLVGCLVGCLVLGVLFIYLFIISSAIVQRSRHSAIGY